MAIKNLIYHYCDLCPINVRLDTIYLIGWQSHNFGIHNKLFCCQSNLAFFARHFLFVILPLKFETYPAGVGQVR